MYTQAILFENDKLKIIDQTLLPLKLKYIELKTIDSIIEAIQSLRVRGAPAIGIVAAYSMYVLSKKFEEKSKNEFIRKMDSVTIKLLKSRPTAVNLSWAIKRIQNIYKNNIDSSVTEIIKLIKNEAILIHNEDRESCHQIGLNGAQIVSNPCNILTHCNAGSLATGGWGTALGVIYAAVEKGYKIHVYVDETRPLGQGARLTFWELMQNKIPCTLITDSTAGSLMNDGKIDLVIFGADRIAKNGDVANKIGSFSIAALAYSHKIPCYCAAPLSTFDLSIKSGKDIIIEQRNYNEILQIYGYNHKLLDVGDVYNPAFDITPARLLKGIITDKGIIKQPISDNITKTINII